MKEKNNKTAWGSLIAVGAFLATKLKFLGFFAKIVKLPTLISMFVSVGAYALVYGWKFAVGFVYLLFMHEMGHLIAMKRKGLPVKPAIFIPFIGAVISVDGKEIPNAKVESYIAFGGPILGTIGFLPFLILYWATNEPLWGVLMFVGAFLNLFNLAPISPLDGGRIVGVLSTKLWFIGLLGMVIYAFINPSPIMLLILLFGTFALFDRRNQIIQHDVYVEQVEILNHEESDIKAYFENVHPIIKSIENTHKEYTEKNKNTYELFNKKVVNETFETHLDTLNTHKIDLDEAVLKEQQLLEDVNRVFLKDTYDKLTIINEEFKNLKKLNFISSWKLKKKIQVVEFHKDLLTKKLVAINSQDAIDNIKAYQEFVSKTTVENQEALNKLKGYYDSDSKTKWTVLITYLLLIALLAVFVGYGHEIMEVHRQDVIK